MLVSGVRALKNYIDYFTDSYRQNSERNLFISFLYNHFHAILFRVHKKQNILNLLVRKWSNNNYG